MYSVFNWFIDRAYSPQRCTLYRAARITATFTAESRNADKRDLEIRRPLTKRGTSRPGLPHSLACLTATTIPVCPVKTITWPSYSFRSANRLAPSDGQRALSITRSSRLYRRGRREANTTGSANIHPLSSRYRRTYSIVPIVRFVRVQ